MTKELVPISDSISLKHHDLQSPNDVLEKLWELRRSAYFLAFRILRNQERAEDAVQEAYLRAWKVLQSDRKPEELRTWLFKVTANCAITARKTEARLKKRELTVKASAETTVTASPTEITADNDIVASALNGLEDKYRLPLSLCYEQGLSQKEAGEVLGWSPQIVSKNVKLGLELLRRKLVGQGFTFTATALPTLLSSAVKIEQYFPPALDAVLAKSQATAWAKSTAAQSAKAASSMKLFCLSGATVILSAAAGGFWLWSEPQTHKDEKTPFSSVVKTEEPLEPEKTPQQPAWEWNFNDGLPNEFELVGDVRWLPNEGLNGGGCLAFGKDGGGIVCLTPHVAEDVTIELDVRPEREELDLSFSTKILTQGPKPTNYLAPKITLNVTWKKTWQPWTAYIRKNWVCFLKYGEKIA
jgi:RNA polymerase sigma-70 factor (ECF subfamily)